MFANFTEETCTGTGVTLALAGAPAGKIPFSESFADGDPVAYSLKDSGGTILIEGVGAYVSATDDITRNDSWNWNGTVVDKNPSINITLSAGTHTIICAPVASRSKVPIVNYANAGGGDKNIKSVGADGDAAATTLTLAATTVYHMPMLIPAGTTLDAVIFNVTTPVASSLSRVGISLCGADGEVVSLLGESIDIDTSVAGYKTATFTGVYFAEDTYIFAWISSDSAIVVSAGDRRHIRTGQYGFNHSADDSRRAQIGAIMATAVAPIYPAITAFSTVANWTWPDLMARYT